MNKGLVRLSHEVICELVQKGAPGVAVQVRTDGALLRFQQCATPGCGKTFWASWCGGTLEKPSRGRYCSDECFLKTSRSVSAKRQQRYRDNLKQRALCKQAETAGRANQGEQPMRDEQALESEWTRRFVDYAVHEHRMSAERATELLNSTAFRELVDAMRLGPEDAVDAELRATEGS